MTGYIYPLRAALILIALFFGALTFAQSPGDDCKQTAEKDYQDCSTAAANCKSYDTSNSGAASQNAAQAGPNVTPNAGVLAAIAQGNAGQTQQAKNACTADMQDCTQKCSSDKGKVPGYCQGQYPNPQQKPQEQQCEAAENQKVSDGTNKCNSIQSLISQLGGSNATNNSAQNQSDNTKTAAQGGMPSMTPPSSSDSSTPQTASNPTPMTAPTTSTACPTNQTQQADGSCLSPAQAMLADGGSSAVFSTPKTDNSNSNLPAITPTPNLGMSTASISPSGNSGGGGSGPVSGSSLESFGATKADTVKAAANGIATAEGKQASIPEMQSGGEGGGGGGGSSAESPSIKLADFLPGHAKNMARGPAALAPEAKHPDITSMYSNMLDQIHNKMQLKCKMKELIGCD